MAAIRHEAIEDRFLGFAILQRDNWFIAVPTSDSIWKVFEGKDIAALRGKIRRWWELTQRSA